MIEKSVLDDFGVVYDTDIPIELSRRIREKLGNDMNPYGHVVWAYPDGLVLGGPVPVDQEGKNMLMDAGIESVEDKLNIKWREIADYRVQMTWKCHQCNNDTVIYPTFYEDSGNPVCSMCGDDMSYVKTEILGHGVNNGSL